MGGISEHAHYQTCAFSKSSNPPVEVVVLCSSDFLDGREGGYEKVPVFSVQFSVFRRVAGRVGALLDRSLKLICDQWRLAWEILVRRPDAVLLASYSEYLSPFWVWPHWVFSRWFGVIYVANLHDPVRDYVVGSKWWHDLSVAMAYWPISVGVVHQRLPEPSPVPKHVQVVEAPVGVYDLQEVAVDAVAIRAGWGVGNREKRELTTEDTESTERKAKDLSHGGTANTEERKEFPAEARRRGGTGDLTTIEHRGRCEKEQPKVGPKGEGVASCPESYTARRGTHESNEHEKVQPRITRMGTDESREAGLRPGPWAGASESDSLASKLADSPVSESPIRSAIGPALTPATSHPLSATTASADVVFLAFGFIRDNKNLDLVIRALVENPRAFLVVMGKAQSQKDKPVEFYRNLALELGVGERVRFFDEFVPDEKLAGYFAAADVVVLTYDKTFHSQSGVLNVAARARRPVLASAGESPLKECVEGFNLGVFVEPDDLDALKSGMACLINAKCGMQNGKCGEPDWEGYEAFASWDVNVGKILEAIGKCKNNH